MTDYALKQPAQSANRQEIELFSLAVKHLIEEVGRYVIGKDDIIRAVIACYIARGHVLIEDRPGVGKSTLSKALAASLGLGFKRIQMTADLLPVDILGGNLPGQKSGDFVFRAGPIFAPIVFVDELNRASARTQSALLEAMEERSVTSDGTSHSLPDPFFVIATQNPAEHAGTSALPDSQLDRFLMKLSMGLPSRENERLMLQGTPAQLNLLVKGSVERIKSFEHRNLFPAPQSGREPYAESLPPGMTLAHEGGRLIDLVTVESALLEYVLDLVTFTRLHCGLGLSPRAALGLVRLAKANALIENRSFVIPDDIKAVFPSVARHRIKVSSMNQGVQPYDLLDPGSWVLRQVPVRI
jgi:MoxR-like ATPase